MATKDEITEFLRTSFTQFRFTIEAVGNRGATVSLAVGENELRPGGTVSGPTLFAVADAALYVAVLGEIGIVPLAVTSSLTINFLRKPRAGRHITGVCTLLKVGRTLAVGEVSLFSAGSDEPVAHV